MTRGEFVIDVVARSTTLMIPCNIVSINDVQIPLQDGTNSVEMSIMSLLKKISNPGGVTAAASSGVGPAAAAGAVGTGNGAGVVHVFAAPTTPANAGTAGNGDSASGTGMNNINILNLGNNKK